MNLVLKPEPMNNGSFLDGITYLCGLDKDLKEIVTTFGNPPFWSRTPGFPTLILIILEQQVSLASAKAAFEKLADAAGELTPARFLAFSDLELRSFGFSRQKTRYGRFLAEAILEGVLELDLLHAQDDESVREKLIKIKGIGPWTADVYLLMVLLRPDIWPVGDLALAKAVQEMKRLPEKPDDELMYKIARPWQPYRAVAARILWHYYLSK